MKKDIHPKFYDTVIECACGASYEIGSTVQGLRTEICSKCHPFYTGTQKYLDTGGMIQRFNKRFRRNELEK